jgi:C4-dicarboxylate-specific signal transduction histidine kinase
MLNLILNAADATNGNGKIHIRLWQSDGQVHLEVHDNGPGIPPEMRDRVFEPLYTSKPDGTGLGLVSVRWRSRKSLEDRFPSSILRSAGPVSGSAFQRELPFPHDATS